MLTRLAKRNLKGGRAGLPSYGDSRFLCGSQPQAVDAVVVEDNGLVPKTATSDAPEGEPAPSVKHQLGAAAR